MSEKPDCILCGKTVEDSVELGGVVCLSCRWWEDPSDALFDSLVILLHALRVFHIPGGWWPDYRKRNEKLRVADAAEAALEKLVLWRHRTKPRPVGNGDSIIRDQILSIRGQR